jgi:hypothetical protein
MSLIGIIASSRRSAAIPPVSGYSLWLDAADATVFSYSSGTIVSQWNDKSANAYHFTQATVANQPSRNATQNSLDAVTFGSDSLKNTSLNWGASASTLFFVGKEDKTLGTGFQNIFTTGTGATDQWGYGITSDGTSEYLAIFDIAQGYAAFDTVMTTGNADVLAFKSAGISSGSVTASLFKNGTAGVTSPTTLNNTSSAAGAVLGSNSSHTESYFGTVCEVILYPSQLNDTDRNSVESYLKTKWGTP